MSGNRKNKGLTGWGAAIILFTIGALLSGGFGVLLAFIAVMVIIGSAAAKNKASNSGNANNGPAFRSRGAQGGAAQSGFSGSGVAPVYGAPAGQSPAYGSETATDAHLCDPDQHGHDDKSYRETLDELEPGYFSTGGSMSSANITRDEFRKKQNELRSLRDAGMISDDEFNEKLAEYRSRLR